MKTFVTFTLALGLASSALANAPQLQAAQEPAFVKQQSYVLTQRGTRLLTEIVPAQQQVASPEQLNELAPAAGISPEEQLLIDAAQAAQAKDATQTQDTSTEQVVK